MSYQLRPYQQDAVQATISYFRRYDDPALIVLPTGAGKSLVIAELARIARGRVLVLAHVKELVEQNMQKYEAFGLEASAFSAGLKRREFHGNVLFASIQSFARHLDKFDQSFSLIIVDECHRIGPDEESQYRQVISHLQKLNTKTRLLGLTATPYRLGQGWIYQRHYHGMLRTTDPRLFRQCIYELPLRYMIDHGYLTPARILDAPVAQYDFSSLLPQSSGNVISSYSTAECDRLLQRQGRITKMISQQIEQISHDRQGVMVFAASRRHAEEIAGYLPAEQVALITGETPTAERDLLIQRFKQRNIKFLVNVSVLTTGFDAPHVDLIAILRPTESVSLYQQIVGRGLRLAENKSECLILDYAGNQYDLHYPEVGEQRPNSNSVPVQVLCPTCDFANTFWGKTDADGDIIEHYGRRCQSWIEEANGLIHQCDYRFRFKSCPQCDAENDIAARVCHQCEFQLVDPDKQLREALRLKNVKVIRCADMQMVIDEQSLQIRYFDEDGTEIVEKWKLETAGQWKAFEIKFLGQHSPRPGCEPQCRDLKQIASRTDLRCPDFVIARRKPKEHFWRISQKLFDYQGQFRQAWHLA